MGVSVLSRLMLRGLSQNVVTLPLSDPVFRTIGVAYRSVRPPSLATRRFLDYLEFRKGRGVSGGGLSELECRRNADGLSIRVESRAVCAFSCAVRSVALLWFQL